MEGHILKENEIMLSADDMGDIPGGRRHFGLYYHDMRYLSVFTMTVNGLKPRLLSSSSEQNYICDMQMANPTMTLSNGMVAMARSISIRRSRYIKDGFHEMISFYNHNSFTVPVELTISFGSDFNDMFEVRGLERKEKGKIAEPVFKNSHLILGYDGLDKVNRRTEVIFDTPPTKLDYEKNVLSFERMSTFLPEATEVVTRNMLRPPSVDVTWKLSLEHGKALYFSYHILAHEEKRKPVEVKPFNEGLAYLRESYRNWHNSCAIIETDNELFDKLIERSIKDLRLLAESTEDGLVPNAGVPWFDCVIGRDSLITALQTMMINPQIAVSTLRFLAKHQGTKVDALHEEEPGKIMGEIRKGELANAKEIPHSLFYGCMETTPLFLMLFAETMKWLDDNKLYEELLPTAKAALKWIDHYTDISDGYIEYGGRSKKMGRNLGWTDTHCAINYPDGTMVEMPVAVVETQAYTYRAMADMADLLERKGEKDIAGDLKKRATVFKTNFNRDFWMADTRFFAQAIDRNKKAVKIISSNPGHGLYCGIIDDEKSRYVANRLTGRDIACGWGIRNVSSRESKFNPMSYRHGSIWPYDNALIVAGMKRYGYYWEAEQVTSQIFHASSYFKYSRLPQLFCGFSQDIEGHTSPSEYPVSCSPQAWSAGSTILLFQSMLGLSVDASQKRIYLNPMLPSWLKNATVKNLKIGKDTVDLHFERRGETTRFEITENNARVEVIIPFV
ncbi:glycogen debranching N-terminal domain-containing protein [Chloroflexota bacterium]